MALPRVLRTKVAPNKRCRFRVSFGLPDMGVHAACEGFELQLGSVAFGVICNTDGPENDVLAAEAMGM